MKKVDARGLSCPEPVGKSRRNISELMDIRPNVSRFATHQGYQVQATEQGDDILLKLTK